MTFLVKCDGCGKVVEAAADDNYWPGNPIDNKSHEKWYSRYSKETESTKHACSRKCIEDGNPVWPL